MVEFIVRVQEGTTECEDCPFAYIDDHWSGNFRYCCPDHMPEELDCKKYNLSTLEII